MTQKCHFCLTNLKADPNKETSHWGNGSPLCHQIYPKHHKLCTRPKGHEGPHVACDWGKHKMDSWGDPFAVDSHKHS